MSLFKPAENSMAYFKAGFMGEAGSGKTHTASIVTIGLIQHLRAKKIKNSDKPGLGAIGNYVKAKKRKA